MNDDAYTFSENLELDSALVRAAMRGGETLFMHTAMMLGLQPSEATARAEWLKKGKKSYIKRVCNHIVQLETNE